jgi:hypothetical protein
MANPTGESKGRRYRRSSLSGDRASSGECRIKALAALLCAFCAEPVHAAGDAVPRAPLEEFLRAYVKAENSEPDKETRYLAAEARLKEGGKGQTLVYLLGNDWCGSSGCMLLVLDQDGHTYRVITEMAPTRPPVRVLSSEHKGWRDIGVWVGGGGIVHGYEVKLTFNGKTYPDNPTLVREKSPRQGGVNSFRGTKRARNFFLEPMILRAISVDGGDARAIAALACALARKEAD